VPDAEINPVTGIQLQRWPVERVPIDATKTATDLTSHFPKELSPGAQRIWDRLLPPLITSDHYRLGDEIGLAIICASTAEGRHGKHFKVRLGHEDDEWKSSSFAVLFCS
jgi:hypothetical protein